MRNYSKSLFCSIILYEIIFTIDIIIISRKFKAKASTKNIKVISEFLSFSDLRQLYHDALFVVIPLKDVCHAGGINAIQEAMAMQKATIVSNSEGVAEYISEKTSIIVASDNVNELKEAIILLQQNNKIRSTLETNSRKHTVDNYACDVLSAEFHSLFSNLLLNHN